MKYSDPVFVGRAFGRISNASHWLTRLKHRVAAAGHEPLPPWSLQALRRSTATMAAECGSPPHAIEVMLSHRDIGGTLAAERRAALQAVANRIDQIVAGNDTVVARAEWRA